jgi:toxin ParE1/3/4
VPRKGAYRLPAGVEARLLAVLDHSEREFGLAARDRYAALILQAMQDVADDPQRPGSKSEPAIDEKVRFYHLKHSRDRVGHPTGRVRRPRHILVYEPASDGAVDILGLIPDMIPVELALPRFTERG